MIIQDHTLFLEDNDVFGERVRRRREPAKFASSSVAFIISGTRSPGQTELCWIGHQYYGHEVNYE